MKFKVLIFCIALLASGKVFSEEICKSGEQLTFEKINQNRLILKKIINSGKLKVQLTEDLHLKFLDGPVSTESIDIPYNDGNGVYSEVVFGIDLHENHPAYNPSGYILKKGHEISISGVDPSYSNDEENVGGEAKLKTPTHPFLNYIYVSIDYTRNYVPGTYLLYSSEDASRFILCVPKDELKSAARVKVFE